MIRHVRCLLLALIPVVLLAATPQTADARPIYRPYGYYGYSSPYRAYYYQPYSAYYSPYRYYSYRPYSSFSYSYGYPYYGYRSNYGYPWRGYYWGW